ncbi:MAG: type II toxin-antitoxin system MqsA family antitoxin [Methanosarcinales archaeon]
MEPCSFCNGTMVKREVDVIKQVDRKVLVIRKVPAWVCNQCGERYYHIKDIERIEKILQESNKHWITFNTVPAAEVVFS